MLWPHIPNITIPGTCSTMYSTRYRPPGSTPLDSGERPQRGGLGRSREVVMVILSVEEAAAAFCRSCRSSEPRRSRRARRRKRRPSTSRTPPRGSRPRGGGQERGHQSALNQQRASSELPDQGFQAAVIRVVIAALCRFNHGSGLPVGAISAGESPSPSSLMLRLQPGTTHFACHESGGRSPELGSASKGKE